LPVIIEHNNVLDRKRYENVVAGLNFPVVNKSVTVKIKKIEIELAASP